MKRGVIMTYYASILSCLGKTKLVKEFDRYSRAKNWAEKQLMKLDSVYNTATITKCGDSTGYAECEIAIFGCNRNFNGEITVN